MAGGAVEGDIVSDFSVAGWDAKYGDWWSWRLDGWGC